ncbi:PQQ-dependent sugar dehydrogenase [Nocardioides panacisoli]|uniref:PQQ-dependent sugar dehydrogenase n=1 Tax=Nocardioides panacisoli TaxID=627624 RepID=UPI001C6325C0|nr:PQQ-dependent sugar dehydrogenase [Nocardioides panacisoli]QYJ04460.1 PQQ-dependent sugar dehydrogenase [Nocardioides panacisoli]
MRTRRALAALLGVGLTASACSQGGNEVDVQVEESLTSAAEPTTAASSADAEPSQVPADGVPDIVGTAARGLEVPWGIDFLPDGRAIVTERDSGRVQLVEAPEGSDPAEPVEAGTVRGVDARAEGGLMGVAVSPDFAEDLQVYFYVTTKKDNRVVRATLDGDELGRTEVVLKGIPVGDRHNGGALLFGEDGHLFVSTGETTRRELAQDRGSLAGKILRITAEGKRPRDNPFRKSLVWSLGHRNVEGMTLDAEGNLWASEFGDSTADEVNLIRKGRNYGWPVYEGPVQVAAGEGDFTEPALTRRPEDASWAGITHSRGFLWAAGLRGERVWRMKVADRSASDGRGFLEGEYGRLRAVATAPDGRLWLGTSNRDGRGDPAEADDRILLVNP